MRKASFFFFLIGAALQLCLHQRGDLKLPLCVCACVCVFVSYLINPSLFHRCRVTIDWPYRTRLSLTLKKKKTCIIYPWHIQFFCLSLLGGLQQVLTILCTPAHTKTKLKRITKKKKEEKQQRKQCLFIRQPLHSRLRSRTFTRQIIVKVKKKKKER